MNDSLGVSELKSDQLYKNRDDNKLYRRLSPKKLERLDNGVWTEVKITAILLQSAEFVQLGGRRAKGKKNNHRK